MYTLGALVKKCKHRRVDKDYFIGDFFGRKFFYAFIWGDQRKNVHIIVHETLVEY